MTQYGDEYAHYCKSTKFDAFRELLLHQCDRQLYKLNFALEDRDIPTGFSKLQQSVLFPVLDLVIFYLYYIIIPVNRLCSSPVVLSTNRTSVSS